MKKIIWAAATAAVLATPAFAADLPRRGPYPEAVYVPVAPAGIWTGFYVGANIGANFSSSFNNNAGYSLGGASGFTGGLQAGYDYQINRFVVGIVGDVNYSSINRRYVDTQPTDVRTSMNWNGSIRARLGYAVQDNMLLYATAGLALGNVRASETIPGNFSQSKMLTGWTAGVGGEYAFTRNWTALLEYRYTSLQKATYTALTDVPRIGFEGHQIRTGINYRF
ncbi:outer membrane protein [Phreatobacter stygius]|uniref:Porin family protein n=1 Tax=Phreatobacter stygius TaxID=1940610 RepID=A0A4D7B9L8_9HYPH|nr:outer membrane protein [Phreatobacter stygius]QCI64722.1 porin family protein [Phreatobacter stygius]